MGYDNICSRGRGCEFFIVQICICGCRFRCLKKYYGYNLYLILKVFKDVVGHALREQSFARFLNEKVHKSISTQYFFLVIARITC